jgi:hypothetical protein
MKALLLASVAIFALSNIAHAEYVAQCSFGTKNIALSISDDANNPNATISVNDGIVVFGTSLNVGDGNGHLISENDTPTKWYISPARKHGSYVRLNGKPYPLQCGGFQHTIITDAPAAQVVSDSPAVTTPTYAPPPVVTAPTATDRVPVSVINNQAHIAVSLGSLPVPMLVDTGCTYMTVTENIADQLLASGQARRGEDGQSTMADGSTRTQASIIINNMTVGGHVLRNVWAGVSPNGAEMLLGFKVLNMVSGKFAININSSTLDFD